MKRTTKLLKLIEFYAGARSLLTKATIRYWPYQIGIATDQTIATHAEIEATLEELEARLDEAEAVILKHRHHHYPYRAPSVYPDHYCEVCQVEEAYWDRWPG